MASQQFSLKWNNHTSNMLSIFENLLSTETFVDVTLACDGLSLKAHKMVLSACSSFFQSLFLENPCKHPIVIMKDVNYKDLKAIVDFMYHGEVNVSQDQLSALLKTAETLKVKGLTEVSGGAQDSRDPVPQTAPPPQNVPIPSSSTPLPHLQPNISDSTPMRAKRKRVRSRKRSSDSNASDDEIVPAKVKEPNSPEIEELMEEPSISVANNDSILRRGMHNTSRSSRHSSVQSQHSFSSKRHSASNAQVQDQGSGEDEVEPSKLLVQTLTTEPIPSSAVSSSNISLPMGSGIEISQVGDNQALVPITTMSDSMSSSHFQGPDSPQDIKPVITFEDQIPGTSQSTMFIDQSSLPGPSGYEDNSMVSQEGQSQGSIAMNKLNSGIVIAEMPMLPIKSPHGTYHCPLCSYSSQWKANVNTHIRIHTGERPFKCNNCNLSFSQNESLKKHSRTHTGSVLITAFDPDNFATKTSLFPISGRDNRYLCPMCSYSSPSKAHVINHIRIHTGERPFKCPVCGKSFAEKSSLAKHSRTHTGEKPYTCDICVATFTQKSNLITHMHTRHFRKP